MSHSPSEVRMLYSEHKKNNDKTKLVQTKITKVLQDHAIENKKARDIIKQYSARNSPKGMGSEKSSMLMTQNS